MAFVCVCVCFHLCSTILSFVVGDQRKSEISSEDLLNGCVR